MQHAPLVCLISSQDRHSSLINVCKFLSLQFPPHHSSPFGRISPVLRKRSIGIINVCNSTKRASDMMIKIFTSAKISLKINESRIQNWHLGLFKITMEAWGTRKIWPADAYLCSCTTRLEFNIVGNLGCLALHDLHSEKNWKQARSFMHRQLWGYKKLIVAEVPFLEMVTQEIN